jgi:hypothetical protein
VVAGARAPEEEAMSREIDALIAKKVMGFTVKDGCIEAEGRYKRNNQRELPAYSTDIACAWQVVGKLADDGYWFTFEYIGGDWWVTIDDGKKERVQNNDEDIAFAICWTVLNLKGIKVPA